MNKRAIGKIGEEKAATYLEQKGFTILCKNYKKNYGEIDIIANNKDTIVFIEVKLRNNLLYGHPIEAISFKKINKITETANLYLVENNLLNYDVRFDVVSILLENGKYIIEHIENAF